MMHMKMIARRKLLVVALVAVVGLSVVVALKPWSSQRHREFRDQLEAQGLRSRQRQAYDNAVADATANVRDGNVLVATETLETAVFDAMGDGVLPQAGSRLPSFGEMILLGLYRMSSKEGQSAPRMAELDSAMRSAYRDYDPKVCEYYVRRVLLEDTPMPWFGDVGGSSED